MSNRCVDFPCCGHEAGCCPDFDSETGEQLDMKCVCGASVPLTSSSSLCSTCLKSDDDEEGGWFGDDDEEENEFEL